MKLPLVNFYKFLIKFNKEINDLNNKIQLLNEFKQHVNNLNTFHMKYVAPIQGTHDNLVHEPSYNFNIDSNNYVKRMQQMIKVRALIKNINEQINNFNKTLVSIQFQVQRDGKLPTLLQLSKMLNQNYSLNKSSTILSIPYTINEKEVIVNADNKMIECWKELHSPSSALIKFKTYIPRYISILEEYCKTQEKILTRVNNSYYQIRENAMSEEDINNIYKKYFTDEQN